MQFPRPARSSRPNACALANVVLSVALLGAAGSANGASGGWPTIELPSGVEAFDIGEQLDVNGWPMRVRGFVSDESPQALAVWFRHRLGGPVVENRIGEQLVLGRAEGDYYLTVQLQPQAAVPSRRAGGSRVLVAVSQARTALRQRDATRAAEARWLKRLPAGSELVSQTGGHDRGRLSQHVVAVNRLPEDANAERLTDALQDEGYVLERDVAAAQAARAQMPAHLAGGRALFFRGDGKEAMAVIARLPDGRTAVMLQTASSVEDAR